MKKILIVIMCCGLAACNSSGRTVKPVVTYQGHYDSCIERGGSFDQCHAYAQQQCLTGTCIW